MLLRRGKALRFLARGAAGAGPGFPIAAQPEIARAAVVVQVFGTDRFEQERLLIYFGVAAQIRGHRAFQAGLGGQRKVQVAFVFRIFHGKGAVCV